MAGGGRFKIKGGIASKGEAVVVDGALLVTGLVAPINVPRRAFHLVADALDFGAAVTTLSFFMGRQTIDVTSPQPGFAVACQATDVFVRWAYVVDPSGAPLDWTLRLRRNQVAVDIATFNMVAGPPATFTTSFGPWVPVGGDDLVFAAGDAFTWFANGPVKNVALGRVVARFEELP